ncbi:GNAT family N-acetyltransferase [bacterium]|nr:GNAT family N-acetyltransferase [bacterium]NUN47007.1 GNAT family N-acetyltransferase [bacterium]
MKTKDVSVVTTYLAMHQKPSIETLAMPPDCVIIRAENPTVKFYRFLYDAVGADWNWIDRKKMADEELAEETQDALVEVYVLYDRGVPAGYAEIDRRIAGEIELKYFGIIPEFISKRYGRFLLTWIIEKAWQYKPQRFWVHTCSLDHPRALPLYQKLGFEIYKTETHTVTIPEVL